MPSGISVTMTCLPVRKPILSSHRPVNFSAGTLIYRFPLRNCCKQPIVNLRGLDRIPLDSNTAINSHSVT